MPTIANRSTPARLARLLHPLLVALALFSRGAVAQSAEPTVVWERLYPGYERFFSLQVAGGGIVVLAEKENDQNIYLLKFDYNGEKLFERTFGGDGLDRASAVERTHDGGFIIVGDTKSFPAEGDTSGGHDIYLIKTNSLGQMEWQRTFGGPGDDFGRFVHPHEDGTYSVIGMSPADPQNYFRLITTDRYGSLIAERRHAQGPMLLDSETGGAIHTNDGGFLIYSNGTKTLLKLDGSGNEQWRKDYPDILPPVSTRPELQDVEKLVQHNDSDLSLSMYIGTGGYVLRLDASADKKWQVTTSAFGLSAALEIYGIVNNSIVVGGAHSANTTSACNFATINNSGTLGWRLLLNSPYNTAATALLSIRENKEKDYFGSGYFRVRDGSYLIPIITYRAYLARIDAGVERSGVSFSDEYR